jgi:hypothetical protein
MYLYYHIFLWKNDLFIVRLLVLRPNPMIINIEFRKKMKKIKYKFINLNIYIKYYLYKNVYINIISCNIFIEK